MPMKNPPHPGLSVRHDCLEPLGLNVTEAARRLGVSRKQLSDIVNCRSGLSPEMAIRLDKAFGGGADTWYRLQSTWDLAQALKKADQIKVERLFHSTNHGTEMMETDDEDEIGQPETIGSVKIEWNLDFDDLLHEMKSIRLGDEEHKLGEAGRFRLKGRCRRCWGRLIGKGGDGHAPTAIRCRVCGILLEGDDAKDEYKRMSDQSAWNTVNMVLGLPTKYCEDTQFVQKVFPHIERQPEGEFRQRVKTEASMESKEGWLTRSEFPAGSVGFLFLQARALMSGVERLPREMSVARFPDFDMQDDGSATVYLSRDELGEHSKSREYELMKRLGSTMTISMMSAFACELAMKAIRLTRMHRVRKSHDLWRLYCKLPQDSRGRIEEDFPEIGSVLRGARHTFDKWRYFEANVGGRGMSAMIDTERAFALAKTARVLLDEAELMGLGYSVNIDATRKVTRTDDRQDVHFKHRLRTKGTEAPPR